MKNLTAELKNIQKIYYSENPKTGEVYKNIALDNINIKFSTSEIHALLGENGAGKSSLVNIISGLHSPTSGFIKIDNKKFVFSFPSDALNSGIAIVHQSPKLVEDASVFENIVLGIKQKTFFSIINRKKIKKEIEIILHEWNIILNLNSVIKSLSMHDRFYTALLCALYRKPRFLILDEPFTETSNDKKNYFFQKLRNFSKKNRIGVILITHKIEEALSVSDKISILRKGKLSASFITEELKKNNNSPKNILKKFIFFKEQSGTHISINNLQKKKPEKKEDNKKIALKINIFNKQLKDSVIFLAEEKSIVGIIGIHEVKIENFENILSGMAGEDLYNHISGDLCLYCNNNFFKIELKKVTPSILLKNKIIFIPSDRYYRASNPHLTIEDVLNCYRIKKEIINKREMRFFALSILLKENIKTDPTALCSSLSGGQLQKILLARAEAENPDVLILSEPARGLDLDAQEQLKIKLKEFSAKRKTVIILTKEFNVYSDLFDKTYYLNKNIF